MSLEDGKKLYENSQGLTLRSREGSSDFARLINQTLIQTQRPERWVELVGTDPHRVEPLIIAEGVWTEEETSRLGDTLVENNFIPSSEFNRQYLGGRKHQISFKISTEVFDILLEKKLFVQISQTSDKEKGEINNRRFLLLDGHFNFGEIPEVMISDSVENGKLNFQLTYYEPKPWYPVLGEIEPPHDLEDDD